VGLAADDEEDAVRERAQARVGTLGEDEVRS
jgi:hypothetical protein